jgi:hypothetical protein
VLTGVPQYIGSVKPLMTDDEPHKPR